MVEIIEKGIAGPGVGLKKSDNTPFRVIGFTDTHFDDYDDKRECAIEAMKRSIEREKPDLIVFIGDNVTGGDNRQRLDDFCELLDSFGIYWCPVLGNHEGDNPKSVTRENMIKRLAAAKYSLIDGLDYPVHLCDAEGNAFKTLYFMDTGTDMTEEEKHENGIFHEGTVYQYIPKNRVENYKKTMMAQKERIPSVVFGHIPLYEFDEAYDLATKKDTDYSAENGWLYGYRREGICSSEINSGMFDAMLECGGEAFFTGHDHINDFIVRYKGITLGYNLPGCYSSYNVICKRDKITVGKTDKLLQGYCIYYFEKDKELVIDHIAYHDIFPDMREQVWSVIRK